MSAETQTPRRYAPALALAATCVIAACGGEESPPPPEETPRQCNTAAYVAFDSANHTNQDLRLGAFTQMIAEMGTAAATPFSAATAQAKFDEARRLYENTAELRAKVQSRVDDHFAAKPPVGMELDNTIMAALDAGRTATTALAANLAKQRVEKTLTRFFFLSVYREMTGGNAENWDEAYGYYGAPSDNAEANRKGLASIATKRDATNGTSLSTEIFNAIVDGSCELAKALRAGATEQIDWQSVAALKSRVELADRKLVEVLAYSAGHEAFEMVELQAELATEPSAREEMWIKLAELDPYFGAIEDLIDAKGGASAARAQQIRQDIDAAWADPSGAWMTAFPAGRILEDLEVELGIDIRG